MAIFDMKKYKAPNHDGFTVDFFLSNWNEVGTDVMKAVQYCFNELYMYKPLNSTILVLVPKLPTTNTMKYFRPIACCNIVHRCFSKILTKRLKLVLPSLIGPS